MNHSYKVEAIVLKRVNVGEADRLVTVYSKQDGKLRLVARGIRRLNSRKKGHLELFNRVKLEIAKGKSLDLITEAQTVEGFANLRKNLNRVRIAYLLAELVDKLTPENQEHEAVYDLLGDALVKLNGDNANGNLIAEFETRLLELLGFGLPKQTDRASLEAHILTITERPLKSKKLR
jgi:DNA repair protein RecO (recombination protein O)